MAQLSPAGQKKVRAIAAARRRLLARILADWSKADQFSLANLNRRFADAMIDATREQE